MFRSVGAILAGLVVNVLLTVLTDLALSSANVFPPFGIGFFATPLVLLALTYRLLFAGVGGFTAARLERPGRERVTTYWLIGIGITIGVLSTVGGWDMFPRWYLIAIVAGSAAMTYVGARVALRR